MPGFEQVARRLGEQRLEGVHAERELDPQQRVQPYVELPGLDAPPACPIEASESSGVLLRHVCRISEVPHASGEPITSGLEDFCIGGVAGQRPNDFLRFGSSSTLRCAAIMPHSAGRALVRVRGSARVDLAICGNC